jgi:thiamine biosynthesis lipoprotein
MTAGLTLIAERGTLRPVHKPAAPAPESIETFSCFGSTCTVIVSGGDAAAAARRARRRLLEWHARFSRFLPDSELSRLNRDHRPTVPVSPSMARFVQVAVEVAAFTGGLVDPTLLGEIERAGYDDHFDSSPVPLGHALALALERAPAGADPRSRWREIEVDPAAGTVTRPPGVRLDSGGIAKGLFGDLLADVLAGHESFAVDAAGDVRLGGRAGLARPVRVASPLDGSVLHVFECTRGAAATSGIGRRSWVGEDGRAAHHLLNPRTGRPAFTGIVQVTALAPRAVEAEARAKAALLSGPDRARTWLDHGGALVYDDGGVEVIAPDTRVER